MGMSVDALENEPGLSWKQGVSPYPDTIDKGALWHETFDEEELDDKSDLTLPASLQLFFCRI